MLAVLDDLHADDLVVPLRRMAVTPMRAAAHRADLGLAEARGLALLGGHDDVVLAVGEADPLELVAVDGG